MSLTIILGILLIAIGAFSAGSFAVPYEKIKQWETCWMVFSIGSYIIMPLLACLTFRSVMVQPFYFLWSGAKQNGLSIK